MMCSRIGNMGMEQDLGRNYDSGNELPEREHVLMWSKEKNVSMKLIIESKKKQCEWKTMLNSVPRCLIYEVKGTRKILTKLKQYKLIHNI